MSLGKPSYDVWIDDKASNPNDFFESDWQWATKWLK
jgi:hypothetical protein